MKAKLLADIYRWENGIRLVFAKKGDIVEMGPRSKELDSMVPCHFALLETPMADGRVRHLGEGHEFEYLPEDDNS